MVSDPPSIEDSLPLGEDKKNVRSLNSAFALILHIVLL